MTHQPTDPALQEPLLLQHNCCIDHDVNDSQHGCRCHGFLGDPQAGCTCSHLLLKGTTTPVLNLCVCACSGCVCNTEDAINQVCAISMHHRAATEPVAEHAQQLWEQLRQLEVYSMLDISHLDCYAGRSKSAAAVTASSCYPFQSYKPQCLGNLWAAGSYSPAAQHR
jgi:hypothetical protein